MTVATDPTDSSTGTTKDAPDSLIRSMFCCVNGYPAHSATTT